MKRDAKQSGDQLNAFLKAGDPVEPSTLSGDGIESALDEIGAEITGRSRRASSRWTRRLSMSKPRAALVIGFATVGIGAAVAGGSQLSAHTGRFQPTPQEIAKAAKTSPEKAKRLKAYVDMGGPGEALDPTASDFRDVALQVASDIRWPDAYESWRDSLISDEIRWSEKGTVETSGALHGWFAMSAFCAWVLDWRYADITGDPVVATEASKVISGAPSWKAVADEDPHLDPAATGEDGKSRASLFGWVLPFRDAVLAGDRAEVEHLLITEEHGGRCQDYDWDWRKLREAHARDTAWLSEERQHYKEYLLERRS